MDVGIDMLLPKGLLHLTASPFVVAYLVLDEGTGIAFVVDEALLCETFDDAVLHSFIEFPAPHLLAHLMLTVFSVGTECRQL